MTNGLVVMTPTTIDITGIGVPTPVGTIQPDGSVTFSQLRSLSLNGVFTSDYDNYMIVLRGNTNLAYPFGYQRLRVSGTDNVTAGSYTSQYVYASSTTVSGAQTSSTQWETYPMGNNYKSGFVEYVFGPYLAQPTAMRNVSGAAQSGGTFHDVAGTHSQSTSYDGITLITQSNTHLMFGSVIVYGFNQ
jgi:hypothetical protein